MADEPEYWSDWSRLWHAHSTAIPPGEVERLARRQRRQMWSLAAAEGGALLLSFIAAMWIATQTAYVAMSTLCMVFFAVCGYLQYRFRKEPVSSGETDLLTSLDASIARETWNLAQLGVGRGVTFVTLLGIVMLASDHLRHYATTPPGRMAAILGITAIVVGILAWNLWLTQATRRRKRRLDTFAARLRAGPEIRQEEGA